jgi:hypothetical protein
MASFASLTATQQKAVKDFSIQLRGTIGELARTLNRENALNASYTSTVSAILALLTGADATIPIDDGTQLAGTMPLTPSEMITLVSHLQAELVINDATHLQTWVKAAGPTNVVA